MTASPAIPPTATGAPEGVATGKSGRGRYHHGDLANALTQAGVSLAREGGPDAVVLREAARRVGVSPAAAYRHFAAHDDLLYAVKQQAQLALASAMEAGLGKTPPLDDPAAEAVRRVTAFGLAYVGFALEEPGLFHTAFLHAQPTSPAPDAPDHDQLHDVDYLLRYRAFQMLSDTLDTLVELGVLPPERRPYAEIPAWSAVHGLAMLLDGPLGVDTVEEREALLKQTIETVINGLVH